MRPLLTLFALALPGLAHAQLAPVAPFVGDYSESWDASPDAPCLDIAGGAIGQVCSTNMLASSGWSFFCSLSPYAGTQFIGSASGIATYNFTTPMQQFGGYFQTHADDGNGWELTLHFYDEFGGLIGSQVHPMTNCAGWVWIGYETLGAPIWSIEAEGSLWGGAFVMMDSMEFTELPQNDIDGDGFDAPLDCDDFDPTVYPGAYEACDGVDNDCDGALGPLEIDNDGDGSVGCIDCDDTNPALDVNDFDNDGWTTCDGDCDDSNSGLTPDDADGDGFSSCAGDCNDLDPAANPGDVDGDGVDSCSGDCDDFDNTISPLVDGDGDGDHACVDCDDADGTLNSLDADGDGYATCDATPDCDDSNPDTRPFATELCDGEDNDCDGVILDPELDVDADGVRQCDGDCDDNDDRRAPGFAEECDGVDNDCDGSISADELDGDGDGEPICAGDCDDGDPLVFSTAVDTPGDGIDQDCDGSDGNAGTGTATGTGGTATGTGTGGTPIDGKEGGCGCDAAPSSAGWLSLLPLLALARRRR